MLATSSCVAVDTLWIARRPQVGNQTEPKPASGAPHRSPSMGIEPTCRPDLGSYTATPRSTPVTQTRSPAPMIQSGLGGAGISWA